MWRRFIKKSWRQAVNSLRHRHPKTSIGCLCSLFGKSREGYYSVSSRVLSERILTEVKVIGLVQEIRTLAPGISAYKLFLILRDIYEGKLMGRDRFYRLLRRKGLMLPALKRRHPTDNAIAERVNGIIKQEWLYREKRPGNIVEARIRIARIIDFYNNIRPHRSNNMKTPKEMRVSAAA